MKKTAIFLLLYLPAILATAQIIPINKKRLVDASDKLKAAQTTQDSINKILNAFVTDVQFEVRYDNPSHTWFSKRNLTLTGNNTDPLRLYRNLKIAKSYKNTTGFIEYNFNGNKGEHDAGNGGLTSTTYKSLLANGFSINIDFSERLSRIIGKTFAADFLVHFKFNNGTKVSLMLQDFNYSGKGTWKRDGDVNITKIFKGNVFPDPANPIILPTIE